MIADVIIQSDGISAKEVNPYQDELVRKNKLGHNPSFELRQVHEKHEKKLRTFEIDTIKGKKYPLAIMGTDSELYSSGTRHTVEIMPDGKIKIL